MSKHVISFHYVLTDKNYQVIDQSQQGHPLIFLSDSGQIIPGLETVLLGLNPGDKHTVTVAAKDAYGVYHEQLVYKVNKAKLPTPDVKVGDMFEAGDGQGMMVVNVVEVNGDEVTLDANHPLAGQDLTFAVEMVEKRLATPEEVAHGHVHGAGGCHH